VLRRRKAEPIDVLVVCTGNMCRSPMIASMLSAAVPSLTVRSAGTGAPEHMWWHPLAIEALAEIDLAVAGTATQLVAEHVRAAKLILTGEGIHRAVCVQLDPTAEERTFTLLEAARLLSVAPAPEGIGAAALAAHLSQALRTHPSEHDDDLPDPITGDLTDFRTCRDSVQAALTELIPPLDPRPS
jgi:protein-tyrosine phosphatase